MEIYVDARYTGAQLGTKEHPFRAISQAAAIAWPGDEVVVASGVYREEVIPQRGGTDEKHRIRYVSEEPLGAVITGAEVLDAWQDCGDGIWMAQIDNAVFHGDNPFADHVFGDWFYYNEEAPVHRAEVYLDGRSMLEVFSIEQLREAAPSPYAWAADFTRNVWLAEVGDELTTVYVHLACGAPADHLMEYTARRHCFYPSKTGLDYITLSGFAVRQAAPQWAPPTAYQEGMIGPHWAKGWIIEDCEISESKCVGISLGKYLQPENENKWLTRRLKHGTQTERDAICQAQNEGWDKEHIGSHIVRRCHIHDCGQAGIVGHLGCVFSLIEDNHIHHINNKQELNGAEIGGIKLHAAIDTVIRRNHIHHCTRGLWLDWQAQGTRVTGNRFHHNQPPLDRAIRTPLSFGEDIFIEVSHGPTLIDHNLLLSQVSARISTQGIAFAHNLIAGSFTYVGTGTNNAGLAVPESVRYTPYHVPHGTAVAGFMSILHGDAQFHNNIFVQTPVPDGYSAYAAESGKDRLCELNLTCGTIPYDGYPTWQAYMQTFTMDKVYSDRSIYYTHLPVTSCGNVYFNGAVPADCEASPVCSGTPVTLEVREENDRFTLRTDLYAHLPHITTQTITTDVLGQAFEPEQCYENPDGSFLTLDADMLGRAHGVTPLPGPFAIATEQLVLDLSREE